MIAERSQSVCLARPYKNGRRGSLEQSDEAWNFGAVRDYLKNAQERLRKLLQCLAKLKAKRLTVKASLLGIGISHCICRSLA